MRSRLIAFFMLAAPLAAIAQPHGTAPARLGDVMVFAGQAHYPIALAAKGVQGRVVLATEIQLDGSFSPGSLAESSGSPELDAAAPVILASLKGNAQTAPMPLLVPILIYKDTVTSLPGKSCREFNVDFAYFASTFPGQPASHMQVFKMATGFAVATGALNVSTIGKLKSASDKTVAGCAEKPSSSFMQVFSASFHANNRN